jgi:hypothetical protein
MLVGYDDVDIGVEKCIFGYQFNEIIYYFRQLRVNKCSFICMLLVGCGQMFTLVEFSI